MKKPTICALAAALIVGSVSVKPNSGSLDALTQEPITFAWLNQAYAEEPEVNEINYLQEGKFEELVEFYSNEINQPGILLRDSDRLHSKRAIAGILRSKADPKNADKYLQEAFDDLGKIPFERYEAPKELKFDDQGVAIRSQNPYLNDLVHLTIFEIIKTLGYVCEKVPDYKIRPMFQLFLKSYTAMSDDDFNSNSTYLDQWAYEEAVILGNYHKADPFFQTFLHSLQITPRSKFGEDRTLHQRIMK